jgi:hypothetical protein
VYYITKFFGGKRMKVAEADKLLKNIYFEIWRDRYNERDKGILNFLKKQDKKWYSGKLDTPFDVFNIIAYRHPEKKEIVLYVQVKDTELGFLYVLEDNESLGNVLECVNKSKAKDNHHFLRCLYSNSLAVLELNHYYIVNA